MKRIRLFAALVCCVATLALPVTPALPAGAEYSVWDDFDYEVVTNDTTGYSYIQLNGYTGNEKDLTIPAENNGVPVEYIDRLNGNCPERLVIPEGVKAIGSLFGEENEALQEVVLPNTLKVIGCGHADGNPAFANANSLTALTIPHSVALIVKDAFPEDLLLRVEAGSYAHRWAKANEQPYEIIEHDPSIGDYDADGLTTTTDARLLLQRVAKKVTFSEEQAAVADVDGDGEVTTTDARLTLQYAAGKEAVDSLTCPLTFNVPFISRKEVERVHGSVVVSCSYEEDDPKDGLMGRYNYSRAPGPLKNPMKMVDYLNKQIGMEYQSRFVPTIKGETAGTRVGVTVGGTILGVNYRLFYYGMSLSLSRDSQFYELVME